MTARTIQSLDIRTIAPRPNPIRPVDDDYALAIAVSFGEATQITPILVRPRAISDGPAYELVCGGHRLRAAELAGLAFVDAEVRDMTDAEARIAEIDENAVRKELSALDFSLSMAERKRLYEDEHPEAGHGKAKKPKKNQPVGKVARLATFQSFASDAAKKTGFSDRTIRRSVELAAALPADVVVALRATPLADNATQLRALARETPADQRAIVAALTAGKARTIGAARIVAGLVAPVETDKNQIAANRLFEMWTRATPKARRMFLASIGVEDGDDSARQVA